MTKPFQPDCSTFFVPTEEFMTWILPQVDASNQSIIEVGAGVGRFARMLSDALPEENCDVIAIDLYPRSLEDSEFTIIKYDATEFRYPKDSIVFCARPCHSDWVEDTIRVCLERAERFYYIGLEDNVERDIGSILNDKTYLWRKVFTNAGMEGESVYEISSTEAFFPHLLKFGLIQYSFGQGISWCELKGDKVYNYSGGFCHLGKEEKLLETCVAHDWSELDWTKTTIRDDSSEEGWLSPEGEFFGCAYMLHDKLAEMYIKKSVRELEALGWCRIVKDQDTEELDYYFTPQDDSVKLSLEQTKWLCSKKIEVRGYNMPDVKQKGYQPTRSFKRQVSGD
jgi:hypothetical protein